MKMSRKGKIFGYYGVVRRHIITHTREAKYIHISRTPKPILFFRKQFT